MDRGSVVTGAGRPATATGGAASVSDASVNVSDADVTAAARAYCTSCSQGADCVTTFETIKGNTAPVCWSAVVTLLRCATAAAECPVGPNAVKVAPPSGACATEQNDVFDCVKNNT